MPRYTFTIHDGGSNPDLVECELPDFNAARAQAIRSAAEMLRDLSGELSGEEWRMEVADAAGKPVLTLRFCAEERT